jgi:hypothetical protein
MNVLAWSEESEVWGLEGARPSRNHLKAPRKEEHAAPDALLCVDRMLLFFSCPVPFGLTAQHETQQAIDHAVAASTGHGHVRHDAHIAQGETLQWDEKGFS